MKTIDRNPARREDAMIKLYIAIDEALMVVSQQKDAWKVDSHLGTPVLFIIPGS